MKKVVLVVDDEPMIVSIIEELLRLSGLDAFSAADADEAEQAIKRHRPDLILLDVMMPRITGFVFCQKLKSMPEYRDIPVIFLTVMNKPEDIEKGKQLGAVDYIPKPFDPKDLIERIKRQLPDN